MFVPVRDIGKGGTVPDLPPWELRANQISIADNVRFIDGVAQRTKHPVVYDDTIVADPLWLHAWERQTQIAVVYGDDTSLNLSLNRGAFSDVSGGVYNAAYWQSFQWGDAIVFNNGNDAPQWLDPAGSNFIDLPNWDTFPLVTQAKVIRPYNNFMVALSVTEGGVEKTNLVAWSDVAEPNLPPPTWDYTLTTNSAGVNPLSPDGGDIVDGLQLGDSFIIYMDYATWEMRFTGGQFVFSFRKLFDYGITSQDAVCAFGNLHFVIGRDRIFAHDGHTISFPADDVIEKTFYDALDDPRKVKVEHYQSKNEIWAYFDWGGLGETRVIIWNYVDDTWTSTFVGDAFCLHFGPLAGVAQLTWDTITTTWDTEPSTWNELNTDADKDVLYQLSSGVVLINDQSRANYWQRNAYLERTGLDLDQLLQTPTNTIKQVRQIIPQIRGNGRVYFAVGGSNTPDGPVTWESEVEYLLDSDYKVDVRASWRYLAYGIRCVDDDWFEFTGFDLDLLEVAGR